MLGAFVLSAVLGVLLAILIVWNDLLLRTVMPVLILFNTLPKIALAPPFVIWLGYGIWPNIVIGTTIAFFSDGGEHRRRAGQCRAADARPGAHAEGQSLAGPEEDPFPECGAA